MVIAVSNLARRPSGPRRPLASGPRAPAALPKTPRGPVALSRPPAGYVRWLTELKAAISTSRRRTVAAANSALVELYWRIGREILERQRAHGWGAKVIERLARDLAVAFPDMRGFSRANLMYMRAFAEAWPDAAIVQQLVGQLTARAAVRCRSCPRRALPFAAGSASTLVDH